MPNNAIKALAAATGADEKNRRISLKALNEDSIEEWVKFIMLVKPGHIEDMFDKLGFTIVTAEDFKVLPKIVATKADVNGELRNRDDEPVSFNLLNMLKAVEISAQELKDSATTFNE